MSFHAYVTMFNGARQCERVLTLDELRSAYRAHVAPADAAELNDEYASAASDGKAVA